MKFTLKKAIAIFAMLGLLASTGILASAEEGESNIGEMRVDLVPEGFIPADDPLRDYVPSDDDFLTESMVTRSITKQLKVTQPCDQDWQRFYPSNWMWQAKRIVVESDRILERIIGVQFVSYSQKKWTRNTTKWSDSLAEVRREVGLSGGDMMMAFSKFQNSGALGGGYVGEPYCIVWGTDDATNVSVGQHEIGHTYTLDDYCDGRDDDGKNCCTNACIMNGGHTDKICTPCKNKLIAQANRY